MRTISSLVCVLGALCILAFAFAASASDPPGYGGGAVISNPLVVAVFWGSSVNSTVKSTMSGFYNTLMSNNYLDWLGEYYSLPPQIGPIGRGSLWGSTTVTITPKNANVYLTDSDVGRELAAQINANVLPSPNANTVYMVYFPKGISIKVNLWQTCDGSATPLCGAHTSTTQKIYSQNVTFPFGIIPDLSAGNGCDTGCGTASMIDKVTSVSSHELAEAITDPFPLASPNGWYPEIADSCSNKLSTITASNGSKYAVQLLWSNTYSKCISSDLAPLCQRISDAFGVVANQTFGFAPAEVKTWWTASKCNSIPNGQASSDLCQKASEIYGIKANVTFGYAPTSVQQWWTSHSCNTAPLTNESLCERASDTYGIADYVTFGTAPSSVRTWWTSNGCHAVPHGLDTCQRAADLYGIVAGYTWGFAPIDVQIWWSANNCGAESVTDGSQLCQSAANLYAIVPFVSWGGAPSEVQAWWTSQGCNSVVPAGPQCQGVSELFATSAGVSYAYAPPYIISWWNGAGCDTQQLFTGDRCQRAADTFGIVAGYTWGFAPSYVQTWWSNNGCNSHPRSDSLRQFTNGP